MVSNSSSDVTNSILPDVLRRLHAQQAEKLATQAWIDHESQEQYLIEDTDLRSFYGETIGKIAHSHWWDIQRIEMEFPQNLGPFPTRTRNRVDKLVVACLLRIADALHVDSLRAPRFLRTLNQPRRSIRNSLVFSRKAVTSLCRIRRRGIYEWSIFWPCRCRGVVAGVRYPDSY